MPERDFVTRDGGTGTTPCERVLTAIGRLQDEVANTWVEPLVADLVAALAEDTTVLELRQEIEFLKAEQRG